ncbi:spore-associated protein A [Streptomyces sp. NPDC060028]|uniref:spore-associated protein A n=1 Tax=Streptomyces sp. NPDC060028 TaxID=3347041 RepID=UPI0036C5D22D
MLLSDRIKTPAARRLGFLCSAAAMVLASAVALPGTAHAAGGYNGECGSGYKLIDTLWTGGIFKVYLTYSAATGNNCVVTIRASVGSPAPMNAWIQRSNDGSSYRDDPGQFTNYAGPVYLHAKGSCIDWGGEFNGGDAEQFYSHCK